MCIFSSHSQYFRETILNEIRKARELYTGMELAAELNRIQQRLDNVECLSVDIVINLLLTYRDIQVHLRCVNISTLLLLLCVKSSLLPEGDLRQSLVLASCCFSEENKPIGSEFYSFHYFPDSIDIKSKASSSCSVP